MFEAWADRKVFQEVRVDESGAVVWPGEIDLCPDAAASPASKIVGRNFSSAVTAEAGLESKTRILPCPQPRASRAYSSIQPPSIFKLTPLTDWLSRRNTTASATSLIVTMRPVGVRPLTRSSTSAGLPLQAGLSPTIPG